MIDPVEGRRRRPKGKANGSGLARDLTILLGAIFLNRASWARDTWTLSLRRKRHGVPFESVTNIPEVSDKNEDGVKPSKCGAGFGFSVFLFIVGGVRISQWRIPEIY